ncbi:MAG: glycosyltransferase family 4 protein, partial [Bacteroidota bacterium]
GLVLSSPPGYSETFFRNKILGLQAHGYEVILFINYAPKDKPGYICKTVSNTVLNGNTFIVLLGAIKATFKSAFFHPRKSYRLFELERRDGRTWNHSLRTIIINEVILNEELDWLHFGYGMLANNKENVAEANRSKMAVSFRGFDLYLSPLKHPGCYNKLFKKTLKYHVLSNQMKERLIKYGIKNQDIKVIPPSIDLNLFKRNNSNLSNFSKTVNILTVARLHWIKGLQYTLQALSILRNQGVKFKYHIIGDGSEMLPLKFAVNQFELNKNVIFLGKLEQKEVKEHLQNSDIYIQYSLEEGFCNAVLEAQAVGLLCIVSNAEGLSENVIHEETGWVVPKREPHLLAKKIIEVIKLDQKQKENIRKNATKRVKERFNLDLQLEKFLRFYEQ